MGIFACDIYLALDVICSTASILLLLTISYDRYQAATKPLEYASPKPLKQVAYVIAVVWGIAIAIAVPILFGINHVEEEFGECRFYNAYWIIFSSLGSFLIPCSIMLVLYWKTFETLAERKRVNEIRRTKSMMHHHQNHVTRRKKKEAPPLNLSSSLASHQYRRNWKIFFFSQQIQLFEF